MDTGGVIGGGGPGGRKPTIRKIMSTPVDCISEPKRVFSVKSYLVVNALG